MKQTFTILLCLILIFSLAACSGSSQKGGDTAEEPDIPLETIRDAIRDALGEDYLPNSEIPEDLLEIEFGITPDMADEVLAEMPMISAQGDRLVLVRAAYGKGDEVEGALWAARERKVSDTSLYPSTQVRAKASTVLRRGSYAAFLMVGSPDIMDSTEEEALQAAQADTQKAEDAFNALFDAAAA